jgi:hypothetical protein
MVHIEKSSWAGEHMENFEPQKVHFLVSKAWKGISKSDVIIDTMMGLQSACEGYTFDVGTTYLVVTDDDGSMNVDHVCSLTHRVSNPPDEKDISYINSLGMPEKVFTQP